jgi:hypothetical protein
MSRDNPATNKPTLDKEEAERIAETAHFIRRIQEGRGWQQKFDKVHDHVDIYVPGTGALIQWLDRGNGEPGKKHTWSWNDPVGETRGIGHWVGEGDQIRLIALVFKTGATNDKQIDMDTLYDGVRKQRWEFDGKPEDHDISR